MKAPPRFITFEGPEGSGKSTQARRLAEWLRRRGQEARLTYEPGDTALGQRIRELLLHREAEMQPESEFLLYSADRVEHVASVILPVLERGGFAISDRYVDSSYAYQGFGRGLSLEWLREVSNGATRGLSPSLTFLLDLPPEEGLARFLGRDRLEREPLQFHERVRAGYLQLAAAEPRRFVILDARRQPDELARRIAAEVSRRWRV